MGLFLTRGFSNIEVSLFLDASSIRGSIAGGTVEWDKLRTQDWKEAVAECTGVRESGGEEWRMDEKDRWNLSPIKQYEVEERKFIEGCYGPIPTGL